MITLHYLIDGGLQQIETVWMLRALALNILLHSVNYVNVVFLRMHRNDMSISKVRAIVVQTLLESCLMFATVCRNPPVVVCLREALADEILDVGPCLCQTPSSGTFDVVGESRCPIESAFRQGLYVS